MAVAVVAILFVVVAQITEERFGENVKRTAVDSIYEYLGETFPVLGYEYWDKVNFTGGKRLFSEFLAYLIVVLKLEIKVIGIIIQG